MLTVASHSLLDLRAFVTVFPRPIAEIASDAALLDLLSPTADAPLQSSDEVRAAVRDLLRQGGFKPTGRSKPASEYLLRAASDGSLKPINVAVDVCNAVSLHSGLPISVVDLDRAQEPFRVAVADEGTSYVFNQAEQTIDVGSLLCLFDAAGPCASAVKDAQRTKTAPTTRRTLSLIWGSTALAPHAQAAADWHHTLLIVHGATVEPVWP